MPGKQVYEVTAEQAAILKEKGRTIDGVNMRWNVVTDAEGKLIVGREEIEELFDRVTNSDILSWVDLLVKIDHNPLEEI